MSTETFRGRKMSAIVNLGDEVAANGEKDFIELDGSVLEGGGQILRNSAALAAITGQRLRISKVRGKRSKPGLRAQHKVGLQTVAAACGGTLRGCEVGSNEVELEPSASALAGYDEMVADAKTAGSCALIAQAVVPVLLFANRPSVLLCRGGTDVMAAPPADFLLHVLQPTLVKAGLGPSTIEFELVRRGFFPRGGGELRVHVCAPPSGFPLPPFIFEERGAPVHIEVHLWASEKCFDTHIELMFEAARESLEHLELPLKQSATTSSSSASGTHAGILLVGVTASGHRLSASARVESGVGAEQAGKLAAQGLLAELAHNGCVDEYAQDQLIIFMALAEGTSSMRCGPLSLHTQTAMWVASKMTGASFDVVELEPPPSSSASASPTSSWLVTCQGAGLSAASWASTPS